MKRLIVVLLGLVIAVPAFAGAPKNGTYKSQDLGGDVLQGRYSESWFPTKLTMNNTVNQQSWDGANLGTQWWWYCPYVVAPPALLLNTVDGNGNGQKIWQVTYGGGVCWYDGGGPWGNGEPTYIANTTTWVVIVTETFANFVEVGTVKTTNSQGQFVGFNEQCMFLQIFNLAKQSDTDVEPHPGAGMYPDFWDWNGCASIGTAGPGEWGHVTDVTLDIIECETVPAESESWGAIKARYND